MDSIEKFGGLQVMHFGRTLVVSFQLLTFVLGDLGCDIRKRHKR